MIYPKYKLTWFRWFKRSFMSGFFYISLPPHHLNQLQLKISALNFHCYKLVGYCYHRISYRLLASVADLVSLWWLSNVHGSDSNAGRRSWNEKLGKCEFTLAFIFLLNVRSSSKSQSHLTPRGIPNVQDVSNSIQEFASWTIWGQNGESFTILSRAADLALILLRHGQYDAVEVISLPTVSY